MDKDYKVSVIVAVYNPDFAKYVSTLNSIIGQKNISFEIIIADDGSSYDYFDEIEAYFKSKDFTDYVFIGSKQNMGIVKNITKCFDSIRGEYIKLISPGDYLYSETTLHDWYKFVKGKNILLCFGNAVFYNTNDEKLNIIHNQNLPVYKDVYTKEYSPDGIKDNYLLMLDLILGASFLVETELCRKYMPLLNDRVIYAEDTVYRLMTAEDVPLYIYDFPVVWYEFGTGISTSHSSKWQERIEKDYKEMDKIMLERLKPTNRFNTNFIKYLNCSDKIKFVYKYFLFPHLIKWRVKKTFSRASTPTDVDTSFFEKVNEVSVKI